MHKRLKYRKYIKERYIYKLVYKCEGKNDMCKSK